MKRKLSIDLETFSSVDIKAGVYKYVESPDFEILLFAYALDDDPVVCLDLASGDKIPLKVVVALDASDIIKTAWNAAFEITCLEKYLSKELDVSQWQCTQIGATMIGLPASLAQAGLALNLDTTKDAAGKALLKLFCKPPTVNKKNKAANYELFENGVLRNSISTHPDKWRQFIHYCTTDVVQERKIRDKIQPLVDKAFTPEERFIWWCDHKINKRGVMVDQHFTKKCAMLADQHRKTCLAEAIKLTKLINPNSTVQIKGWLEAAIGESIKSLNKKFIPGIKAKAPDKLTKRVIELRQELSKSSIKKFTNILTSVCADGRVRGLHKYNGGQKTGRWSSNGVQIHNLKRNEIEDIDEARQIVNDFGLEEISMLWDNTQELLSQLIRPAFISKPGYSLAPSDFSAIEARITAWLAGEEWRLKIFRGHGRIYEASAAKMFKVPVESISYVDKHGKTIKGKNYPMRFKGKIGELALGFGGGLEALRRMGGETMGLTDEEMISIVRGWRKASPNIVEYWAEIQECAMNAIRFRGKEVKHKSNVAFQVKDNILWLKLPSGRYLTYREPRIDQKWVQKLEQFKDTITYVGMEQTRQKITRLHTYGGKLVENIVQATARDLLAGTLVRFNNVKNLPVVMHVHDEIILEISDKTIASDVLRINKIMVERPEWALDLPLAAETTVSKYYKK